MGVKTDVFSINRIVSTYNVISDNKKALRSKEDQRANHELPFFKF